MITEEKLNEIVIDCINDITSLNNTNNDVCTPENALNYYSIFYKYNLHKILLESNLGGLDSTYLLAAKACELLAYHVIDTLPTLLTTIHCYELIKSASFDHFDDALFISLINESKPIAFCLTEKNAGSDINAIETIALHSESKYVLTGHKVIVINCGIASYYVVVARSNKKGRVGLNIFLVPSHTHGIRTNLLNIAGFTRCSIGSVVFDHVAIENKYRIGEEGSGYFLLTEMLDKGRPLVAACCIGGARKAFDLIVEHIKKRKQFSKTLFSFQSISFAIAEFETRLRAAQLLCYDACQKIDSNEPFSKEASMAKYYSSRLFLDITTFGMDVLGYSSLFADSEIKKLHEIAQAMMFIDGTENVQKMIIASLI